MTESLKRIADFIASSLKISLIPHFVEMKSNQSYSLS